MEPHEVPDQIGRYEVIQHLASGGMADLFLCRQTGPMGFEKVAALKKIRSRHSEDSEFLTMFMDEARVAALLNHPNIAQIYDLGDEDGSPYLAMEFVNGRNLSAIFKKSVAQGQTIPEHIVAGIMRGIVRGLAYAHGLSAPNGQPLDLVHRDVTPQNVIVSHDGQIKLVDFGIAKAATQMARTRHGVIKGKYSYMSPEQVRSEPLDGRSDLFAVGILMYEALTARRPFKRSNTVDTLKAVVQDLPPDPRRFNAAISKPMIDIIARSLFKKRDKRFRDAHAMLSALEKVLHDRDEPVTDSVIAQWTNELFESDETKAERTIVLKDIGEILLPDAESVSVAVSLDMEDSEQRGVPEKTVISMLSEVEPAGQSELSGSLSVRIEEVTGSAGEHDHQATVPHRVEFEAKLEGGAADERTIISDPPLAARLDDPPPERSIPDAASLHVMPMRSAAPSSAQGQEDHAGGFRVVADDTLPPRPGPQRTTSSYSQAAAEHRLTLLKFIALGVGIGATLLVGLILFSK